MLIFLLFSTALKALEALLARVVSTSAFWDGCEEVLRAVCNLVVLSKHPNTILTKICVDILSILNQVDADKTPVTKS